MAEEKENAVPEQASKRAKLLARLKAKHPDKDYADDESLLGQVYEDYGAYEQELGELRGNEEKLGKMLSQYPHSARFVTDMANGKNPWVSMVEQLGMDGITDIFQNPEYKEELAKAQEAYVDRLSKGSDLEKEFKSNLEESLKMLRGCQEEDAERYSDDRIDAGIDILMGISNDAIMGKFSRESLDLALKVIDHDRDVAEARATGEVAGRNAKIEEKLRKPRQSASEPPVLNGSTQPEKSGLKRATIFDIAAEAR